jgi:nitrogen regulatory protein P-II 1
MKRVEAIIRPHRLSEALAALAKLRITGVTVLDTMGFGTQPGYSDVYEMTSIHPNEDLELGLVRKKMLVMFVEDDHLRTVVDTIMQIARTGYPGDGKIAISPLEELIRVRTTAEG